MKKYSLFLLVLLFAPLSELQAQRQKDKEEPSYQEVLDSMATYNFEAAIEMLEEEINKRTKRKRPTEKAEELLTLAHRNLGKLMATERLIIVDSIIVDKKDALQHVHLSSESGQLQSMSQVLNKPDTMDCVMFRNQLENQMIFSQQDASGKLTLYKSELIGSEWTKPAPLKGIADEDVVANYNYPFMLTDGATLYYSATDEEGLGGYDIYMTRYDADEQEFLVPENIGMPFNSTANDYLFAIDEFHNLGWFATDRGMPDGKVCIYTFIPNETRQIYNESLIGMEALRKLASIYSIHDTWTDKEKVDKALQREKSLLMTKKNSSAENLFEFVLNNNRTCYSEGDFKNAEARNQVKTWLELNKQLKNTRTQLEALRDKYADASAAQKEQFAAQIRLMESTFEKLLDDVDRTANAIRKAELGQ